jgi:hypothetical protein
MSVTGLRQMGITAHVLILAGATISHNPLCGPFVPRLIDTEPPTTRQRHFGEQTPALILDRATGNGVLTHFRDKHFYVVA